VSAAWLAAFAQGVLASQLPEEASAAADVPPVQEFVSFEPVRIEPVPDDCLVAQRACDSAQDDSLQAAPAEDGLVAPPAER